MTHTISVEEVQQQFTQWLALASQGAEVVITERDKPVARLVSAAEAAPAAVPQKRIAGLNRGAIWVSDDFDEPLPDSFWLGEENEAQP